MQESSKQNYLHGAAIMAAGVVVIKILGAIYKIPLGNILGDEGYGYFSVAYNIYNVFLTMATAGMPVALSRMISEADTLGRPMQARKIFRVAWLTFATIGLILGLVMFLFPTELAGMLNNVRAAQSIWALSPALVLVYLTSTYRGYAQGMSNMKPTTVSQILEVVGKVTVGLVLAWSFTRAGKSLPVASAGAILASRRAARLRSSTSRSISTGITRTNRSRTRMCRILPDASSARCCASAFRSRSAPVS
ncbi:MAG: oligosaccharide flippase family protein [Oscillospiraceae bacterium]